MQCTWLRGSLIYLNGLYSTVGTACRTQLRGSFLVCCSAKRCIHGICIPLYGCLCRVRWLRDGKNVSHPPVFTDPNHKCKLDPTVWNFVFGEIPACFPIAVISGISQMVGWGVVGVQGW